MHGRSGSLHAVDAIAERIRSLGHPAPGSYASFSRLSNIPDTEGVPKAKERIQVLLDDHETVIGTARAVIPAAEKAPDQATADLLTGRLQVQEKTAWMLRSLLED